jgi:transcriptional regulator with XRE-family HTH domain
MYPNLKLQLWKCGIRQNRLAQILDVDDSLLSKVINGFREPNREMRRRIAEVLACDEVWLFDPVKSPGAQVKVDGVPDKSMES